MIYGIIGAGKVATHLKLHFDYLNLPYSTWSRRDPEENIEKLFSNCNYILVLIKDDAISQFIDDHPELDRAKLVHFSGAQSIEGIKCTHPLMAFNSKYDSERFNEISFICEKETTDFKQIFPWFKNPYYYISKEDKALYHALCVLSGNFTHLLWKKVYEDFERLGIPPKALVPYLKQTLENCLTPLASETGPLSRGDVSTINKNLNALTDDPYKKVYEAFIETKGIQL